MTSLHTSLLCGQSFSINGTVKPVLITLGAQIPKLDVISHVTLQTVADC